MTKDPLIWTRSGVKLVAIATADYTQQLALVLDGHQIELHYRIKEVLFLVKRMEPALSLPILKFPLF